MNPTPPPANTPGAAPSPAPAPTGPAPQNVKTPVDLPKTTDGPADTGAGKAGDAEARKQARKPRAKKAEQEVLKLSDTPEPKPATRPRRGKGGSGK